MIKMYDTHLIKGHKTQVDIVDMKISNSLYRLIFYYNQRVVAIVNKLLAYQII